MYKLLALALVLLPTISLASNHEATTGLQGLIRGVMGFIDAIVIPVLLAAGFLFFIINVVRYFVFGSAEEEGRKNAKNLAIYSVLGFVILIIFWGIINLLTSSIGLDCAEQPTPDYIDPDAAEGYKPTPCNKRTPAPEDLLRQQNDDAAANGNIACQTTTPSGGVSTIVTSPANCASQGGQVLNSAPNSGSGNSGNNNATNDGPGGISGFIENIFDFDDRPFRDYFWANWGRGGSSGSNNNSNGNNTAPDVACLLPNGTIEQRSLDDCFDAGGEVFTGSSTNVNTGSQNSFQVIDCVIFDPTTGQQRTIQATPQDCASFNDDSNTPSQIPGANNSF